MAQIDIVLARDREIDPLTRSRAEKSSVEMFKHAQGSGRVVHLIRAGMARWVEELDRSRPVLHQIL